MSQQQDFTQRLRSLDLGPIAFKLMHPDGDCGWTRERTLAALSAYRQFLQMTDRNGKTETILTADVRKVWESHVLDTQKYRQDCQMLFGYVLHFEPERGDIEVDRHAVEAILATLENQARSLFGV